jgi:hypothetical protein
MALASVAETTAQLQNAIKPFTDLIVDYPTIVSDIDTAEQALEGDYLPGTILGVLRSLRARLSATADRGMHRAIWNAWCLERMRIAGLPFYNVSDNGDAWIRLHRLLHEGGETFNDRGMTIAAAGSAGGGNVGDGTHVILKVDWEGYVLQHAHAETMTWECIADQNLGVFKHAEIFQVRGEDASKDLLDETGSGLKIAPVYVQHAGSGGGGKSYGQNMSFDTAHDGTGTDKVPGWTITTTAGDFSEETTNVYKGAPNVTTSRSLEVAAGTDGISQALSVTRINAIGERIPWMLSVPIKLTSGSDTGTVTLTVGSKSQAFDIGALISDTNWYVLRLDLDKDLYYRNWITDAPTVGISWASMSAAFWLDDIHFAPMTYVGGLWHWLEGGGTAFLQRDVFTNANSGGAWADAELMNSAKWAGVPVNLPTNAAGAETIADP